MHVHVLYLPRFVELWVFVCFAVSVVFRAVVDSCVVLFLQVFTNVRVQPHEVVNALSGVEPVAVVDDHASIVDHKTPAGGKKYTCKTCIDFGSADQLRFVTQ